MHSLRIALLFASTLAMSLVAGFFFAYACSVMLGLARLDDIGFILAMQAINATVRNAWFAFSFFGALAITAAAAALYLPARRSWAARLVMLAFVTYAIGGFGVTFALNVPMNETLAAADLSQAQNLAAIRRGYEAPWVFWNEVRALASTAAALFLFAALFCEGRASCARERSMPVPA